MPGLRPETAEEWEEAAAAAIAFARIQRVLFNGLEDEVAEARCMAIIEEAAESPVVQGIPITEDWPSRALVRRYIVEILGKYLRTPA